MKARVSLLVAILVLGSFGLVSGQTVFVNMDEVEGLVDGTIHQACADLVIPIRFTNNDEARSCISNGYKFSGEGVTWTGIDAEWNPDYCFVFDPVPVFPNPCNFLPNVFFDVAGFITYFDDGVGFSGLVQYGTGLPAEFDDIAYYITIEGVLGEPGQTLTMDSTWGAPANVWLWCGEPIIYPDWGGPYQFAFDSNYVPLAITSTPITSAMVGVEYVYEVDILSCLPVTYFLITAPPGMVIDEDTGVITWTPDAAGDFVVEVAAVNELGMANQAFVISVFEPVLESYTYCWPQPTYLKATENSRILEIRIFEQFPDLVDPNSIVIQGVLEPINEVRIEDGLIVAECRVMRFIGISGFRPIPPEGIQDTYTVEYVHSTKGHVTLTGDFVVEVTAGDVNLDGMADIADVQFMSDFLWGKGPKCEFEEFMDVDGNGQLDIRDALKLIDIVEM